MVQRIAVADVVAEIEKEGRRILSSGWRTVWTMRASGNSALINAMWRKLSGRLSVTSRRLGVEPAHLLEICFPEQVQSLGRRFGQGLRIWKQVFADDGGNELELAARGDPRVTAEDLLHQSRARAEHSHDEDRACSAGNGPAFAVGGMAISASTSRSCAAGS